MNPALTSIPHQWRSTTHISLSSAANFLGRAQAADGYDDVIDYAVEAVLCLAHILHTFNGRLAMKEVCEGIDTAQRHNPDFESHFEAAQQAIRCGIREEVLA